MKEKTRTILYGIFVSILVLILGIGYAQVSSELKIEGKVDGNEQEGVYIVDATYISNNGADTQNSKINYFFGTMLDSKVTLGSSSDSTISYKVTIKNNTDKEQLFIGIVKDETSEIIYSNTNIQPNVETIEGITGLEEYVTTIAPGEYITFPVTFGYAGTDTSNPQLRSKINFRFREKAILELDKDGEKYTLENIYAGYTPEEYEFTVSNYNEIYTNEVPMTYSIKTTLTEGSPLTAEIYDENGNLVTDTITVQSDGTQEEHKYILKLIWDKNKAKEEYNGKEYNCKLEVIASPDSEKYLQYAIEKEFNVDITTKVGPIISEFKVTEYDTSNIAVTATATEEVSGIHSYAFQYKLSTEENYITATTITTSNETVSYTYTELSKAEGYNLKVIVTDNTGTSNSKIIEHGTEGIHEPELIEGMIAVEWNGANWVKADKNTDSWYSYGTTEDTRKWANAVTVKESGSKTREEYSTSAAGTEIAEEDILGMYVWIPRYGYKIERGYHTKNNGASETDSGYVDIKFLGTSNYFIDVVEYNNETTAGYTKFPDQYVMHPAFNLGDTILGGIWVAKFEASSSTTTTALDSNAGANYGRTGNPAIGGNEVTIRPNVTSWRYIHVNNMYNACTNMVKTENIHGLPTTADSHLMKDTEWGAVAYLTQSDYGNAQISSTTGIWNNNYQYGDGTSSSSSGYGYRAYCTTRTGMVGRYRDDATSYYAEVTGERTVDEENGTINIKFIYYSEGDTYGSPTDTSEHERTYYEYWTTNGQKGSTTGNIYGIYDMAGGSWEYQASYLGEISNTYTNYFNNNVPEKHKLTYSGTYERAQKQLNYELNKDKYGNALWEISSAGADSARKWWLLQLEWRLL